MCLRRHWISSAASDRRTTRRRASRCEKRRTGRCRCRVGKERAVIMRHILRILPFVVAATALAGAQAPAKHPITLDDMAKIRSVRDPQCSPDGRAVAYVVSSIDVKADKNSSHVWMVGVDGTGDRQVTSSLESESSPRWSRDGKYLAFTS